MDERLLETLADIAFNVGWERIDSAEFGGSRAMVKQIIAWAKEFERRSVGIDWDICDYIDAIDEFTNEKLEEFISKEEE